MAREHDTGRNDRLSEQTNRLAANLRDEGVSPERDLWPDIEQAITEAETEQLRPRQRKR